MVDLHSILADYRPKKKETDPKEGAGGPGPTFSEIPDLFFDHILVEYKLARAEIIILMHLYRKVWCRPNIYRDFGIGPLLSYKDMGQQLGLSLDENLSST